QRSTRELGLAPSSVPCLTLLPVGFAVPTSSPRPRWSLTPPFHPYRLLPTGRGRRSAFCGTVPRITPGGCYPPPFQVEPGLSSAPLLRGRGCPADWSAPSLRPTSTSQHARGGPRSEEHTSELQSRFD